MRNSRPCTIWRFTRRRLDLIITDWRQCTMKYRAEFANEELWGQKRKFWNKRRGQESEGKTAWTQKPQWENGSTAVQGLPQTNLHNSILWEMASFRMLILQVREWMRIWWWCSYAHRQVEEQLEKIGDRIAVAILKNTRQLGCVS